MNWRDPRILFAVAMAIVIAAALGYAAGRKGGEDASRPPELCLNAWNNQEPSRAFGVHNYSSHGYREATVRMLALGQPEERCAVIFGAAALDPEPLYAGQILDGVKWRPFAAIPGVDVTEVARIQTSAQHEPNASLEPNGKLRSLP